jgi:hypothetical protein
LRMVRAHLTRRTKRTVAEVAGDVGGIHAQVMSAAETSLGIRIKGLNVDQVRSALWEERSIVKAWTLRGTLHLHPAEELPMWLAARAAVTPGIGDQTLETYGVTRKQSDAITEAIGDALDGACLSRQELAEAVAKKVGKWAKEPLLSGWGTMLGQATLRGWLCHGPPQGNTVTFVRADQWTNNWSSHDTDAALRWVARRYLEVFGPATHATFHAWFNGPIFKVSHARRVFDELEDELERVEVEGKAVWMLKSDATKKVDVPAVRFLPLYDCYVVGFREREHLLTAAASAFATQHPKGRMEGPVAVQWILIDGMIEGTWSRTLKGKRVEIMATCFKRPGKELRSAIEEEAEELGRFWNAEVALSFSR